jgi:hypothetical protein
LRIGDYSLCWELVIGRALKIWFLVFETVYQLPMLGITAPMEWFCTGLHTPTVLNTEGLSSPHETTLEVPGHEIAQSGAHAYAHRRRGWIIFKDLDEAAAEERAGLSSDSQQGSCHGAALNRGVSMAQLTAAVVC